MFIKKKSVPDSLDNAIESAFRELDTFTIDEEDYATAIKHLSELYKLRELQKPKQLSPDVVLTVGANLFGILAILHHERANVIASKALGFVLKLR